MSDSKKTRSIGKVRRISDNIIEVQFGKAKPEPKKTDKEVLKEVLLEKLGQKLNNKNYSSGAVIKADRLPIQETSDFKPETKVSLPTTEISPQSDAASRQHPGLKRLHYRLNTLTELQSRLRFMLGELEDMVD